VPAGTCNTLAIVANGLEKIPEAGTLRRAEQLYQQLDLLQHLRQQARRELLAESRKHAITAKLRKIPSLGPIRSALAVALIQTPHRFHSKRQLWTYSGLGLETRDRGEYHFVKGQPRRRKKQATIRGLNKDYNHGPGSFRPRRPVPAGEEIWPWWQYGGVAD
jgi:transposase